MLGVPTLMHHGWEALRMDVGSTHSSVMDVCPYKYVHRWMLGVPTLKYTGWEAHRRMLGVPTQVYLLGGHTD